MSALFSRLRDLAQKLVDGRAVWTATDCDQWEAIVLDREGASVVLALCDMAEAAQRAMSEAELAGVNSQSDGHYEISLSIMREMEDALFRLRALDTEPSS